MEITNETDVEVSSLEKPKKTKVLIIRFSSIGDIVLCSPVIRCVKQQIPDVEVHFLTRNSFKAVTEANPYVDRFFYFNNNLDKLISQLEEEKYDYIIDLHKNFRTNKIKLALNCKAFTYKKESVAKFFLTKFHINLMSGRHITDRSLDTVASLGVKNDGRGLDYFLPEHLKVSLDDLPAQHRFGYIAIVIGASYYTKKLPVVRLQKLCQLIEYPIVLIGGKEDIKEAKAIAEVDPYKIYDACGKFSLHESAWLVKQAKLVISHDTGLQYVASAFNKKILAIWGGTSPKLDVEPYYPASNATIMHHNFVVPKLLCQPCSNYGSNKCPKGHFKCMKNQDLNKIADTAMQSIR